MKRNLIGIVILCIAMVLGVAGCRKTREEAVQNPSREAEESVEEQEPLMVFYDAACYNVLENYMKAHPEVKLKGKEVAVNSDEDFMQLGIEQYGEPDIVLLSPKQFDQMEQWCDSGLLVNLTDFYMQDEVDSNAYFPGVFDAFETEKALLGLPLAVSMQYITVRDENWQGTALAELPEGYTGSQLMEALRREIGKPLEEGWFFSGGTNIGIESWMYQLGGIQRQDGSIQVDEQIFEQVYAYSYLLQQNYEETEEYYQQQDEASYYQSEYNFFSGLDHRMYNGKVKIDVWRGAPQIDLVYAKSANQSQCGQGTHVLWIPAKDDGSSYLAEIRVCGAVGGKAQQAQRAYEVLRQMMDMEYQVWSQPISQNETYFPVNRDSALRLVDDFNSQEGDLHIMNLAHQIAHTAKRQNLTEEEANDLKSILSQITGVYREKRLRLVDQEPLFRSMETQGEDYHLYYDTLVGLLNDRR